MVRPKAPQTTQTTGKRDLKTGKRKDGFVIKSLRLYEKPGMAALMSAIDLVEVNDETQESEVSLASI